MFDFTVTSGPAFAGDSFIEGTLLRKGEKPTGGGWEAIPGGKKGGYRRRRGGKFEYYYPHPDGKPGKHVRAKKSPSKSQEGIKLAHELLDQGTSLTEVRAQVMSQLGMDKRAAGMLTMDVNQSRKTPDEIGRNKIQAVLRNLSITRDPQQALDEVRSIAREYKIPEKEALSMVREHISVRSGAGGDAPPPGKPIQPRGTSKRAKKSGDGGMDEFDALIKAPYTGKGKRTGTPGNYKYTYTDVSDYKMRVTGKGHEDRAKKLKQGIEDAADICKVKPSVCKGNLGIERKDMPQFDDKANPNVVKEYLDSFKNQGVKVTNTRMHVGQLKATQKEINAEKVDGMVDAHKEFLKSGGEGWSPGKGAIVVSNDGYVLDGHHRWAAMLDHNPDNTMPVHKVDAPIRELLKRSEQFYREGRGVKKADFAAPSIGVKKSMSAGDAFVYASWLERISKAINDASAVVGDEFDQLLVK